MVYFIISFLGLLLGPLIAKFTKEELKPGYIYFRILELVILFCLFCLFLYHDFSILVILFGIVMGIILRFEYLYFGFGLMSSLLANNGFLASSLVFIYGLANGTLLYYDEKLKFLLINGLLFFLPFLFYFLEANMFSFAAGGLISIFVIRLKDLIRR